MVKYGIAINGHVGFLKGDLEEGYSPKLMFNTMRDLGLKMLLYVADSLLPPPRGKGTINTQIAWMREFTSLAKNSDIDIGLIVTPTYGWEEEGDEWYRDWRDEIVRKWMNSMIGYAAVKTFGLCEGEFFGEGLRKMGVPCPEWQGISVLIHDKNLKLFGNWALERGFEILHLGTSGSIRNLDSVYYMGRWISASRVPFRFDGGWLTDHPCPWLKERIYPFIKNYLMDRYSKNKKAIASGLWSREVSLCEGETHKCWAKDVTSWFLQAQKEEAPDVKYLIFIISPDGPIVNSGFRQALRETGTEHTKTN